MCAFPELGLLFASDALARHGLATLEGWVAETFARRDLVFLPGREDDVACRSREGYADMSCVGGFVVSGCGCGWKRILDVRDVVRELFDAADVKRARFGLPWYDSVDAARAISLDELEALTFADLDQRLVEVRRTGADPRPTRRLCDLARDAA